MLVLEMLGLVEGLLLARLGLVEGILRDLVLLASRLLSFRGSISSSANITFLVKNHTVCPRSSDPFYIVRMLYKMGH